MEMHFLWSHKNKNHEVNNMKLKIPTLKAFDHSLEPLLGGAKSVGGGAISVYLIFITLDPDQT